MSERPSVGEKEIARVSERPSVGEKETAKVSERPVCE